MAQKGGEHFLTGQDLEPGARNLSGGGMCHHIGG